MAMFTGFKPSGMQKIANRLGYKGDMVNFDNYLQQNPDKQRQMIVFEEAARKMAEGGVVRNFQQGGFSNPSDMETFPTAEFQPTLEADFDVEKARQVTPDPRLLELERNFSGMATMDVSPRLRPDGSLYMGSSSAFRNIYGQGGSYQQAYPRGLVDPRDAAPELPTMTPIPVEQNPGIQPIQGGNIIGTLPSAPPVFNYTYEQALSRNAQRDVKSPEEQAAINAALERGPSTTQALPTQPIAQQNLSTTSDITDVAAQRLSTPGLPQGTQIQGVGVTQEAGQFIPTSQGQVAGAVAVPTAMATTTMAEVPRVMDANVMTAETASANVGNTLNTVQAAQATQDPKAQVVAAQQVKSAVGDLNAAQGNATVLTNPIQREIQAGELVSPTANAEKAKAFTEQIEAATATPTDKATVAGQLASLTANFDATNPPSWAAGAIRGVQAVMQQRGLGASSIAGQALVQAAMESAIPIAQADARTVATFEAQNLSNRQQRAMLSAQQRAAFIGQEFDQEFQGRVLNASKVSDIANRNFTAEQQIALENSRIANSVNLQNLSNSQALVMAEASALASLDTANLNARQQAAVQNAQNFLQQDMANLSNQQQVELFKAQQRVQSLFTDQAAQNASRQFNASSQNQVDQFFANLATQSAQFNATQANAQSQYNAGQRNVLERFNAELNNQRDTFNAQNRLVIDQNNAQWRRQIATAETATTNRINELNANNLLNISNLAYNNLWQYYADTMEWAWTSAENELNRYADMSIANLNADTQAQVAKRGAQTAAGSAVGSLIGTLGSAYIMSSICWVAREIYGKDDSRWVVFRMWLKFKAPKWFKKLYEKYGESYAKFISNKPILKYVTKKLMNMVIKNERLVSYA
jgi:hypothetical protein